MFLTQELSSFRSYQLKWFIRLNDTNPKMESIAFQSESKKLCGSYRNSSLIQIQWTCPTDDVAKARCYLFVGRGHKKRIKFLCFAGMVFEKSYISYVDYLECDVDVLILLLDLLYC